MIRRQLPAYSPISLKHLAAAAMSALGGASSARAALRDHLSARFEADWVVLTGSGTQALQLALGGLDPPPSDRGPVVMPAYSCFDLVTAAVGAGMPLRFYDLDPVTLSPDPASLARASESGCRAIVGANLFGFPLDWGLLRATADRCRAVLIEDAAQGLGSTWMGRELGRFGDMTVLSFGRGKGWTGGSGGALMGRGARAPRAAYPEDGLAPARHGSGAKDLLVSTAVWALGRPSLYRIPASVPMLGLGETRYKEPVDPARISAAAAATALRHADASFGSIDSRRRRALRLDGATGVSGDGQRCEPVAGGEAGYLRYPWLAVSREHAGRIAHAGRDLGIARGYPVALPDLPVVRSPERGTDHPGALRLVDRLLTFPTHPRTTSADMERIEAVVRHARRGDARRSDATTPELEISAE